MKSSGGWYLSSFFQSRNPAGKWISQNRLSPHYINIATTRYNELLRPQHNQAQKKKREKSKENNAETGGSTKTKMTRSRCVHRRIPTTLLAL
jgi:hypothetical protein